MHRTGPLILGTLAALWTAAAAADSVTLLMEGEPPLRLETVRTGGLDHLVLEDFIRAVRQVDPQAFVQWNSPNTLRMQILGVPISLFSDRAAILMESRLHPASGPLLTSMGDILVPAATLRDLFAYHPGLPPVEVMLPSAPPPAAAELTRPADAGESLGEVVGSLPITPRTVSAPDPERGGPIAVVAVIGFDDRMLVEAAADLLQERIEAGTHGGVLRLTAERENWDAVLERCERESPRLVVALQVGHSAQTSLAGAGVFLMAPGVAGAVETTLPPPRTERYRASAELSDLLAQLVEAEFRRAQVPWLGRVTAPHRLLRCAAAPAVIVELGQASNPAERDRLAAAGHQARLTGAIAQAVIEWSLRTASERQGAGG
jgi:hypothetical protein